MPYANTYDHYRPLGACAVHVIWLAEAGASSWIWLLFRSGVSNYTINLGAYSGISEPSCNKFPSARQ